MIDRSKYNISHARAVRKYNKEKLIAVDVRLNKEKVRPGFKDEWRYAAKRKGMSLSQFVYNCVEENLGHIDKKIQVGENQEVL